MAKPDFQVVTGAFGYSGRYIAQKLLEKGLTVKTLTNSIHRNNPFARRIEVLPFNFNDQNKLVQSLIGCSVLYNTYWIRFNHKDFSHREAVTNTLVLFRAAKKAGVKRIVHVSITNPDIHSHLEYFRGKAELEKALQDSGISYAILRPAVIFGEEDILIHNIAWMIKKFPVFGYFGNGEYRLQPIHVQDFADLAVTSGLKTGNFVVDAIGPETFKYKDLVKLIAEVMGEKRVLIGIPPSLGYLISRITGKLMNDILVTREEIRGLMADLLCTDSKPVGKIKLSDWLRENADEIGRFYRNELARRRNRDKDYRDIK